MDSKENMADALLQTDQLLTEKEKEIEGENSWKHSRKLESPRVVNVSHIGPPEILL